MTISATLINQGTQLRYFCTDNIHRNLGITYSETLINLPRRCRDPANPGNMARVVSM